MSSVKTLDDDIAHGTESLDDLISVIAHELRNPLLALRVLAAELLEVQDRSAPQTRCAQRIADVASHLTRTTEAILDARRQAGGTSAARWQRVDVQECCSRAARLAAPLVKPGVTLSCDHGGDAAEQPMYGDAEAITRLMLNLLANAARHTECGTIDVRIERVPGNGGGEWIRVAVSDNGAGMDSQTLRMLGFPFTAGVANNLSGRQAANGSAAGPQLGVGLWLCRNIAASHGGELSVCSVPGKGTTVYVHLATGLEEPPAVREIPRIRILEPGEAPALPAAIPPEEAAGGPAACELCESRSGLTVSQSVVGITGLALLTAIAAQISVPIPGTPVPMTLQSLPVVLAPIMLGAWRGAAAMVLYTLLGIVGLPVFAGATSGLDVLLGPTGGYLLGFVLAQFIITGIIRGNQGEGLFGYCGLFAAMLIGHMALWVPGVLWLRLMTGDTWSECLSAGLWPFLPGALLKSAIAAGIGAAYLRLARRKG